MGSATTTRPPDPGRLARALADAVVIGDSHGDVDQAAKILGGAVRRHGDDASTVELLEALAYLLELAIRRHDPAAAREALARIDALEPTDADRTAAAGALASVASCRARGRGPRRGPAGPLTFAARGAHTQEAPCPCT